MAIADETVWEVRAGDGDDTNGGGFVRGASGTDYSQQDAAQASPTDLAIDATDSTIITSTTLGSDDGLVGNLINVTAGTGFTTGRYEILSHSGGQYTLDRSCGTTSSTGGSGKVGGALATLSEAASAAAEYNHAFCTGTFTETLTMQQRNTVWIGYSSSRTDGGYATIDAESTRANCIHPGANKVTCQFLNWICEDATSHGIEGNDKWCLHNVVVRNCGDRGINGTQGNLLTACEAYGNTNEGMLVANNDYGSASGCYSHDNGGAGFRLLNGFCGGLIDCIADSNTGNGIEIRDDCDAALLLRCTSYNNGADGVGFEDTPETPWAVVIRSCIFANNTGYAVDGSALNADPVIDIDHCLYYSNTAGDLNAVKDRHGNTDDNCKGANDVSGSDPLFLDPANGDFGLDENSPAIGVGWPQQLVAVGTNSAPTSRPCIGASHRVFLED